MWPECTSANTATCSCARSPNTSPRRPGDGWSPTHSPSLDGVRPLDHLVVAPHDSSPCSPSPADGRRGRGGALGVHQHRAGRHAVLRSGDALRPAGTAGVRHQPLLPGEPAPRGHRRGAPAARLRAVDGPLARRRWRSPRRHRLPCSDAPTAGTVPRRRRRPAVGVALRPADVRLAQADPRRWPGIPRRRREVRRPGRHADPAQRAPRRRPVLRVGPGDRGDGQRVRRRHRGVDGTAPLVARRALRGRAAGVPRRAGGGAGPRRASPRPHRRGGYDALRSMLDQATWCAARSPRRHRWPEPGRRPVAAAGRAGGSGCRLGAPGAAALVAGGGRDGGAAQGGAHVEGGAAAPGGPHPGVGAGAVPGDDGVTRPRLRCDCTPAWAGATPDVSVVVPLFEQGQFLADAVDSVVARVEARWPSS